MAVSSIPLKFAHFGCWGDYKNKKHIDQNIDAIGKYNPNFLLVAGDNYYPKKKEDGKQKKKIYNEEQLHELFQKLGTLKPEIEIIVLMGNHELDRFAANSSISLNKQLATPEVESGRLKFYTKVESKVLGDTLIIMVDTNLYLNKYKDGDYTHI